MKCRTIIGGIVALVVLVAFSLPTEVWGQREEIATPEYLSSIRTAKKPNPCASLDKKTKQCIRRISKNQAKKQIEKMDSGIAFYKNSGVAAMNCKESSDQYTCISPEYSYYTIGSMSEWATKSPEALLLKCDKGPNDARIALTMGASNKVYGIIGEPDKRVKLYDLYSPSEAGLKEKMAEYTLVKDVMKIIYCIDVSGDLKVIGQ